MKKNNYKKFFITTMIIVAIMCCFCNLNAYSKNNKRLESEEWYKKGKQEYDKKNYIEAFQCFKKAAEQGNPEAQLNLGQCYLNGQGTNRNDYIAFQWFKTAAEQGHPEAQFMVASGYWYGRGTKLNDKEAFQWFKKAAEQGNPEAQYKVGYCLEEGIGTKVDLYEAKKWYKISSDNGNSKANDNIELIQKKIFEKKILSADYFDSHNINNIDIAELNDRLLTWEEFYNINKKTKITYSTESIEKEINSQIETWQKKGEFETTDQWKTRVNDETRNKKIEELKNYYLNKVQTEIENINNEQKKLKQDFLDYRNYIVNIYYEKKINNARNLFSASNFDLKPYDADNETFLIHTTNYGDILLPVQLNDAPSFKENWHNIKSTIKPEFVPNGDDVALTKLVFTNNRKEYVYDSHTKANYAITDVEYNFEPIEIADINLSDLKIDDFANIPREAPSKIVTKSNSDVLTAQNVQVERKNISASEKSNVDTAIPNNNPLNNSTSFAVIIANENYHSVSNVPYASKDGAILEKYLTQAVGLPKDHVKIYNNASYGNMAAALKHIENLSEAFGNELNLIFYYAGHGMANEKTKNPMLLPIDGDVAIPETCFELDKIISTFGYLNANSVVVMLDACFSGTERGDAMLMAARGIRIKSNNSQPIGNMVILSASQGDETAYPFDTEQHGLFTYFLLKKLQENRGDVTLGELSDYITDQVKRQSVVSNGKLQIPSVSVSPEISSTWRNLKFGK